MAITNPANYAGSRRLIREAINLTLSNSMVEEIHSSEFVTIEEIDAALMQAAHLVLDEQATRRNVDNIISLVTAEITEGFESELRYIVDVMLVLKATKNTIILFDRDRRRVCSKARSVEEAQYKLEAVVGRSFSWEEVTRVDIVGILSRDVTRYVAVAVPDWQEFAENTELLLHIGDEESFWFSHEIDEDDEDEREAA